MSVIFILIGISLVVAIGFLIAFLWAVKNGQYEDDYTPSVRILFDDETSDQENQKEKKTKKNNSQTKE
jgi:cbb3-type cytochrome oxidase maturation protein